MLDLENALASRHPQWLRGRPGRVARSVLRTLVRATRVEEIEGFIAARRHLTGFALVEATLEWVISAISSIRSSSLAYLNQARSLSSRIIRSARSTRCLCCTALAAYGATCAWCCGTGACLMSGSELSTLPTELRVRALFISDLHLRSRHRQAAAQILPIAR